MVSNFLGTGADTIPVPLGAGMRRTRTDPHLPLSYEIDGLFRKDFKLDNCNYALDY